MTLEESCPVQSKKLLRKMTVAQNWVLLHVLRVCSLLQKNTQSKPLLLRSGHVVITWEAKMIKLQRKVEKTHRLDPVVTVVFISTWVCPWCTPRGYHLWTTPHPNTVPQQRPSGQGFPCCVFPLEVQIINQTPRHVHRPTSCLHSQTFAAARSASVLNCKPV